MHFNSISSGLQVIQMLLSVQVVKFRERVQLDEIVSSLDIFWSWPLSDKSGQPDCRDSTVYLKGNQWFRYLKRDALTELSAQNAVSALDVQFVFFLVLLGEALALVAIITERLIGALVAKTRRERACHFSRRGDRTPNHSSLFRRIHFRASNCSLSDVTHSSWSVQFTCPGGTLNHSPNYWTRSRRQVKIIVISCSDFGPFPYDQKPIRIRRHRTVCIRVGVCGSKTSCHQRGENPKTTKFHIGRASAFFTRFNGLFRPHSFVPQKNQQTYFR